MSGERVVVPGQRHVERYARDGIVAETRSMFRDRLLDALAPDVALAEPDEARMALGEVLPEVARAHALLSPLARTGGLAWQRTVDAVHAALGTLRACGTDGATLAAVARGGGTAGERASVLADAMRALDVALAHANLVDGRRAGTLLAEAISAAEPEAVRRAVGAGRVVARWIVVWDPADLAWWRALDVALARSGGARIELPAIDYALDLDRDPAPLDILLEHVGRALGEAPPTVVVDGPLGDLRLVGELANPARIELRQASDGRAQARAIADSVHAALAGAKGDRGQLELLFAGAAAADVEAIAVALPRFDEETLEPIRLALDDAGIVAHDARRAASSRGGVVAAVQDALALGARGLPRADVAALLRSGYVDANSVAATNAGRGDALLLRDVARALEETPTVRADDAVSSLEATACAWQPWREETLGHDLRRGLARAVGAILARPGAATTRREHIAELRQLVRDLGVEACVVALPRRLFATDEPPRGIARAELRARAHDAHAWTAFVSAVAAYEIAVSRLGLGDVPATGETFRHELARAVEAAAKVPAAARAGAVRVAHLAELAGEPLDLLVIADANEGILPPAVSPDVLLTDALAARLREVAPDRAPPRAETKNAEELALLACAAARAKRIVLCYRDRDDGGALLAPAPLVSWLERSLVKKSRWTGSPIAMRPLTRADAVLAALARGAPQANALAPDETRRARVEREREAFFETDSLAPTAIVGRLEQGVDLTRVLTEETGGGRHPLSITGLEKIATCPFQGYAAQVLRASERRASGEVPDAREGGTLLHAALAAAFRATAADWSRRPRDAAGIARRARAAVDALLCREEAASGLRRLTLDRVRENVEAVVAWSLADESWDFVLDEQPFGDVGDQDWPALVLEGDRTRVSLRGSIDRIDAAHAEAALRVVDYKSSETSAQHATKQLGETAFQVALYGSVAARRDGAKSAFGIYVPAQASALPLKKRRLDNAAKAWEKAHERVDGETRVVTRALEVVQAFREGALVPIPIEKTACDTCSFDGGCRKPRFVIRGSSSEE